jgi:hypothetical protein
VRGEHHDWDLEEIPVAREHNYTARGIEGDFVIPRQYLGGFDLESGTKVYLRFDLPAIICLHRCRTRTVKHKL